MAETALAAPNGAAMSSFPVLLGAAWDLMRTAEVAALLGVSRQRGLQLLNEQDDFPQPVALLRMGKVWHGPEMRAWADRPSTARP